MTVKIKRNSSERLKTRMARHRRIRKKVRGTNERPRLGVFRSLKHIYAQVTDDNTGSTLVSASTRSKEFQKRESKAKGSKINNQEAALVVGELVAEKALAKGIKKVVFDRGGYSLHGRVKTLAQGARDKGLEF
jgi:large subunit ribosomal protein L18